MTTPGPATGPIKGAPTAMVDDIPSLDTPASIVAPNRAFSSFISSAAKSSADVECYLSPGLELVIEAACGYEWRWEKE